MERSLLSALIGALLGITTLGGLAFVWENSGKPQPETPEPPPPRMEGEWRLLGPVTYENLSIFPVVSSESRDTSFFLTLEEGLASGEVVVRERGSEGLIRDRDGRSISIPPTSASVNQLVLINRSKRPLLLLAGELVSGGKQDRIIGKDRIVPAAATPIPLDVFCVEHGRWTGSSEFSAARTIVHPSVRENAAVDQAQTEVWAAVRNGTNRPADVIAGSPSPRLSQRDIQGAIASEGRTEAYEKIYHSGGVGVSIDDFVAEVQRRFSDATSGLKGERVVGVVVAYGGEIAWSDIFASSDLFDHYWHKLLRSYVVEALARPTYREVASRDRASEFLRSLNGRETQETEPGVYRWREIREGHLAQIELDALQPRLIALHRLMLRRTS
jgi:hypothetical protein